MAIALVTQKGGSSAATASSFTFSVDSGSTGSNRVMVIGFWSPNSGFTVSSCTYAGVAATAIGSTFTSESSRVGGMFAITNPATGTNDLVFNISTSISEFLYCIAVISDAKQTGLPDSVATRSGISTSSFAITSTVVEDQSWLFMMCRNAAGPASDGASTILVVDVADDSATPATSSIALFRSTTAVGPGSQALTVTRGASTTWGGVMASFAPAAAAADQSAMMHHMQIAGGLT